MSNQDDLDNNPEFQEWASSVVDDLIPTMQNSKAVFLSMPTGQTDVKFAVELGFSIMLDKPIVAVVHPDSHVPEKIRRVADAVIEADLSTPNGAISIKAALKEFMDKLSEEEGVYKNDPSG